MQPIRPHSRTTSRSPGWGRAAAAAGVWASGDTGGLCAELGGSGLEELDRVSGRVVEQDLRAAGSLDDIVAEAEPGGAQPGDLGLDVVDDQVDAVPAAGAGPAAVGHRPAGRAARAAQEQPPR